MDDDFSTEYDYRCKECDCVFQVVREIGYMDDEACPKCGGTGKRVFTVFKKHPSVGGGACSKEGIDAFGVAE
ncbi:MAG: FmdB family zinc ribbon protein [Coriobacteriia bacterium]